MKTIDRNQVVVTHEGKPYQIIYEAGKTAEGQPITTSKDATVRDMIELLVGRLPMQVLTMDDAAKGTRIIAALRDGDELEDADYDWLMTKVESIAPTIYGLAAYKLKLAIEAKPSENGHAPSRPVRRRAARR